jgi:uncharacterized protein YndB with AHSA1/START domain
MSAWRQQALVEAPVDEVWALISDPSRFAEWSAETMDVTGAPTRIEKGSTMQISGRGPLRMKATTTFQVDELEDLREIKLRCQTSGFYSHWLLTEAQGNTFTELEFGVEHEGLPNSSRAIGALHTKRYLRRAAEKTLDGLRRAARRVSA